MSEWFVIITRIEAPLNFSRGIIGSPHFSPPFMMTFLLLPSLTARCVLPQLKPSVRQKEYTGRKKLHTGYLPWSETNVGSCWPAMTHGRMQITIQPISTNLCLMIKTRAFVLVSAFPPGGKLVLTWRRYTAAIVMMDTLGNRSRASRSNYDEVHRLRKYANRKGSVHRRRT
jgi:hypothetical protein